jgi:integral membrane protein (TIGR00529 family)
MLMVYLVFFLTNYLSSCGAMKRIVGSLENMISDPRVVIAAIPMVIGLMPVLSGAIISAPFADQIGQRTNQSKERRHVINYWFRHVSEYINPIYPGVLLATGMLGISFYTFILANLPVMAFYLLMGAVFFLGAIKVQGGRKRAPKGADINNVLFGVAPILVAVILPVLLKVELVISLAVAVVLAVLINRDSKINLVKLAKESLKLDLILLVFLVMLFKTVLENSNAAPQISSSLVGMGFPVVILLVFIPMLMGFLTGLTVGYVG